MSAEECTDVINKLVKVIVTFETHLPALLRTLDVNEEWEAFFRDLEIPLDQEQEDAP
jgi:hypothetical protein